MNKTVIPLWGPLDFFPLSRAQCKPFISPIISWVLEFSKNVLLFLSRSLLSAAAWVPSPLRGFGKVNKLKGRNYFWDHQIPTPPLSLRWENRPRWSERLVQVRADMGLDSPGRVLALCTSPGDVWRSPRELLHSLLTWALLTDCTNWKL